MPGTQEIILLPILGPALGPMDTERNHHGPFPHGVISGDPRRFQHRMIRAVMPLQQQDPGEKGQGTGVGEVSAEAARDKEMVCRMDRKSPASSRGMSPPVQKQLDFPPLIH